MFNLGLSGLLEGGGLAPQAGLSDEASLVKFGFPLSLNPHLLFDTRTSMLGELESPTLDLDAAVPSSLDVITATRSGVATYTDVNGVIQSAPADTVRVDYTQGEELTPTKYQRVGYTDFSSGWILDGATKTNQSTPYGDGVLLTQDTSSGEHNIIIIISNTGQHTFSLKVKPNGVTKLSLSLQSSSANSEVAYDTVAGTATIQGSNVSDASIKDLGGGWFLVKLTNDSVVERARIRLRNDANLTSYVGDGASGLFLANPQVEEGTTASDFVPNTTGSPKFITGATFGPRVPMMLIEPSAENLVDYSNLDKAGVWSVSGFSVTQNAITSPDGLNNGTKTEQTSTTRNFRGTVIPSSTGTSVTYSFWVKKGSGATHLNKFIIRNSSRSPSNMVGSINLESGEIIQNDFGSGNLIVEQYPNGWFRVKATRDTDISVGDEINIYPPYSSSSGENEAGQYVYTFGHQVEYGTVATSFIPTSGSAVTRNADNLVIDGTDFTDFYNTTEGTVYVEVDRNSSALSYPVMIHGGSSANYLRVDSNGQYRVKNAGVDHVNMTIGSIPADSLARVAFSYKYDDFRGSVDGGSEVTDNSGAVPAVSELQIGAYFTNSSHINGHLKRLIYWPVSSSRM